MPTLNQLIRHGREEKRRRTVLELRINVPRSKESKKRQIQIWCRKTQIDMNEGCLWNFFFSVRRVSHLSVAGHQSPVSIPGFPGPTPLKLVTYQLPEAKADLSTAVLLAMIIIAMAFAQTYLIRKIRRLDLAVSLPNRKKKDLRFQKP
ncbi:hypothetical protein VNO78_30417 [Psophocarpus tetragonolobus]|uniref:Uncharacterized protein n=1 Tax=Psophocarpus tetragonolobus TaxID=3891 RepID=A0AAN9RXA2_PSOTE